MEQKHIAEYEKSFASANNYEKYIWGVFSTIVVLSLWVLYKLSIGSFQSPIKEIAFLFGFSLCIYSIFCVINLDQKRQIEYSILTIIETTNLFYGRRIFEKKKGIYYFRLRNWGVLIFLFAILAIYFVVFLCVLKFNLIFWIVLFLLIIFLVLLIVLFSNKKSKREREHFKERYVHNENI